MLPFLALTVEVYMTSGRRFCDRGNKDKKDHAGQDFSATISNVSPSKKKETNYMLNSKIKCVSKIFVVEI